jgi:hypothetical protein
MEEIRKSIFRKPEEMGKADFFVRQRELHGKEDENQT